MKPRTLDEKRHEVMVVDVRYPEEWEAGRIDGALHIPLDDLDDHLDVLDTDRQVVTVCRSGSRSAEAAEVLRGQGIDAENLEGGMLAWAEAGLPVVGADGGPGRIVEPDPPSEDFQRIQADFMDLILEVQEHFGDHDPTEEEVQGYLRERLIRDGSTPEEADEVMARVIAGSDSAAR